jgi:hypothetical protein
MESDSVFQIFHFYASRFPHPVDVSVFDIPAQLSIADLFSLPIHQRAFFASIFLACLAGWDGWTQTARQVEPE